jgi:REP element-mobilizing transposase RayT
MPRRGETTHSRGYLPHIVKPGATYFVTFRLADSLPQSVLADLEAELRKLCSADIPICQSHSSHTSSPSPSPLKPEPDLDRERRKQIESFLDRGTGACWLKDERIAAAACTALKFFDRERYELCEWDIMPNHVHVIVRPIHGWTLSAILQSWKLKIATDANKTLGKTGQRFWQPESFDRIIRDADEMLRIRRYIRRNPVKARLCPKEEDWKWSSAWREPQQQ